jgi:hypothetical protein
MQHTISDHIRSNVLGLVAVFIALSGTAYAIDGPLPGQNQVGSEDIINGEVKNGDIGTSEVKANNVAPDSLGGNKIVDRSVKNADLGLGASSSNTIADGGIQGIDVKNNTLTGQQIDESTLSGVPSTNAWNLDGNSGTAGTNFVGTTDNNPLNLRVNNARGLRLEPASDGTNQSPNVIGGIADNSVTPGAYSATIGGGGRSDPFDPSTANKVTDNYGTVGGGARNQAGDDAGAVDGAQFATVGGGRGNAAGADNATVSGGGLNNAAGFSSSVGGGQGNTASGLWATVPGGASNTAQGFYSLASGNGAQANHDGAFVWADSNNFPFPSTAQNQFNVRSTGGARLVSGIDGSGNPASGVELPAGATGWSTLVNGQPFDIEVNNSRGFRIDPAFDGSDQAPNVIGGTADNSVTPGVHSATIAGGGRGLAGDPTTANQVTDDYGTVGGGGENLAGNVTGTVDDRSFATVSGGVGNTASGAEASVSGGEFNTASGSDATVSGGSNNLASGRGAAVAGGENNLAGGLESVTLGGHQNLAQGDQSLAAGFGADAAQNGTFVWADSSPFIFTSTAANQFSVRSTGGARFVSAVNAGGAPTAGVQLASGGGSWSSLSDRASKRAIRPASGRKVLRKLASVPVSTWSYRAQERSIRHIGPMAQDFYRAFGVGEDRRHIASVDADGVALAAIKGLNRELRRKLSAERRRRHEQERRMDRLEARVAALERGGR